MMQTAACAVAFHEKGPFLASGSYDTNVKIWDTRTSNMCMNTFKGHKKEVGVVKISSCGHFVASGSGDGSVRLYDLREMKMIQEFIQHTAAITGRQNIQRLKRL